jgi:hypothetical protein
MGSQLICFPRLLILSWMKSRGNVFCATCALWKRSGMERLSVKRLRLLVWDALPWAAWSNARSSLDKWPVCPVRPTIGNGTSIQPFNKRFASSTAARPGFRSRQSTPHVELKQVASRLRQDTAMAFVLPSYDQVRRYIQTLPQEPKVRKERGEERGVRRERQSPLSFALSIPAPAQLAKGAMNIPWNALWSRKMASRLPAASMLPCSCV